MRDFALKHWRVIAMVLLLILPLGSFLLASTVLLVFIYFPKDYDDITFETYAEPDRPHAVVLAHGVKDELSSWVLPLAKQMESGAPNGQVFALDWRRYAENALRCAIDGRRIGERIGLQLASNDRVDSVHLIGHSCGSFVVFGACQAIKELDATVSVQTTYLDPVSVYGLFWHYGLKHFGSCADYSEAYIDTGDGIPGSNELLPNTRTYDVTAVRIRRSIDIQPHLWPTLYYQELIAEGRAPQLRLSPYLKRERPPGVLEIVE